MRAVIQRVTRAAVRVDGREVGSIGPGLLVLVGVAQGDGPAEARRLASKTAELRVFADPSTSLRAGPSTSLRAGPSASLRAGSPAPRRFDRSLLETGGEALVVSQFTLLADVRKGRRPSFTAAAAPDVASGLVDAYAAALRELGVRVATGRFGAHMLVELENDGPVTLVLDTAELERPRRGSPMAE